MRRPIFESAQTWLPKASFIFAISVAAAFSPVDGFAANFNRLQTVADLRSACEPVRTGIDKLKTEEETRNALACLTYVQGVVQSSQLTSDVANPTKPLFCEPNGTTNRARAAAFLKWSDENQKDETINSTMGVLLAVEAAFPCPKK